MSNVLAHLTDRRVLTAASSLLTVGALIGAWILGVPRLEAYASRHQEAGAADVRFVDPPAWVKGELKSTLLSTASRCLHGDAMGREGLMAAREALLATGWFDEISQVRRVGTGVLEITARFARPFAVIREDAGPSTPITDYLIDTRGRLLPRSFAAGGAGQFTAIVGARFGRPARPGQPWEGTDVVGALRLLNLIQGRPWRNQVAEIDVADLGEESSIRLTTDRGCTIIWGRAPGEEHGREVSARRKLDYLDYHHNQYGHIDRGFPRTVDITGDVVIGR